MLTVPLVLLGAAFCLAWAYALGSICLRRLPVPWEVALAAGTAVESSLVFLLLSAGAASTGAFLSLGAVSFVLAWRFHGLTLKDPRAEPASRAVLILCAAIGAAYGAFYFVNALAPEIQSDAIGYHLGFAAEYVRTGEFPDRVGFFEMVPQGMEMLFTVAFAIGRHSAAKLVHFGFLVATVPLLVRIGRRLRLGDSASLAAAGIYFCAPVTGISGTCAYNDAALVFFSLIPFYLLLVWQEQGDDRYLLPAGIAAGFCYAIKFTGIIVLPLAMLAALVAARRIRPLWLLAPGIAMIAPWMVRDAVMTGNPLAPLFNRWFPNPYFRPAMEGSLASWLRSYGVPRWRIPAELAVGGQLQGTFGPLLFALPLGLLALRRRAGRWCWLAAGALAVPWFWNIGARFLMPAFVFAVLALMLALPRRAAAMCLAFHAITCWPQATPFFHDVSNWRLREFPWRAAFRIESEDSYLTANAVEYPAARLIQSMTLPNEQILALTSVAWAYTDRTVLEFWHSSQADLMVDWLRANAFYNAAPLYDVIADWPPQLLRAVRFRLNKPDRGEWDILEVRLYSGEDRISSSPQWTLSGWPNVWELTAAFDNNLGTRWRSWSPMRPGMYAQADLNRPQRLSGATLISHSPVYGVPIEVYGMEANGRWHSFGTGKPVRRVGEDLRRPAMRAIKQEGFHYLLVPRGNDGLGPLGRTFAGHEEEWGLQKLGEAGGSDLYRIR